eukprot:TRINITY_DN3708_c2_g2_i3.p2 TRINITY_DN3708_c2_g2~~TRINITY_DN3708_c2_g2_i3.p2  ORF type:complete len:681 (-),score=112.62 TRINITY_DN3708_c2_g2_i3:1226-3268(-)
MYQLGPSQLNGMDSDDFGDFESGGNDQNGKSQNNEDNLDVSKLQTSSKQNINTQVKENNTNFVDTRSVDQYQQKQQSSKTELQSSSIGQQGLFANQNVSSTTQDWLHINSNQHQEIQHTQIESEVNDLGTQQDKSDTNFAQTSQSLQPQQGSNQQNQLQQETLQNIVVDRSAPLSLDLFGASEEDVFQQSNIEQHDQEVSAEIYNENRESSSVEQDQQKVTQQYNNQQQSFGGFQGQYDEEDWGEMQAQTNQKEGQETNIYQQDENQKVVVEPFQQKSFQTSSDPFSASQTSTQAFSYGIHNKQEAQPSNFFATNDNYIPGSQQEAADQIINLQQQNLQSPIEVKDVEFSQQNSQAQEPGAFSDVDKPSQQVHRDAKVADFDDSFGDFQREQKQESSSHDKRPEDFDDWGDMQGGDMSTTTQIQDHVQSNDMDTAMNFEVRQQIQQDVTSSQQQQQQQQQLEQYIPFGIIPLQIGKARSTNMSVDTDVVIAQWFSIALVCDTYISQASSVLQECEEQGVLQEFLDSEKGIQYLRGIGMVYQCIMILNEACKTEENLDRVADCVERCQARWSADNSRLGNSVQKCFAKQLAVDDNQAKILHKDVHNNILNQNRRHSLEQGGSENSLFRRFSGELGTCGLSLQPITTYQELPVVVYKSQMYIAPLLNLWLNEISQELPNVLR